MKLISFNANGIRASAKKGFFDWFLEQNADILCLQETKAQVHQLDDPLFCPKGYYRYFFDAEKKGYSGVGIYCKKKPLSIQTGLGFESADTEGRYLEIQYKKIKIASAYLPSGTSGQARQNLKYDFLEKYLNYLKKQLLLPYDFIIAGDFNIAHTNQDIKNWKSNQKNSGFLPEERAWLDTVFQKLGLIDTYRYFNPEKIEYTWWSNRANAWANNVGWRIDYQIISPNLKNKILKTDIYRAKKFSDHAPFSVDYDIDL